MQFTIEREIFLKALTRVQGIIEKRHTIPILANVLIEAKANNIFCTATDLEVGVRSFYEANIKKEGRVTVSAKKVYEIIKELPNKEISFAVKDNFWVEIKCGKSIFNLVGLSPDEFPKYPESNNIELNEISSSILKDMIDKTIFSVSNDETKYNLTGIYFKSENKNTLSMVSTDGHRLSMIKKTLNNDLNLNFNDGFILPKKGIYEIRKLTEDEEEILKIGISENNFIVSTGITTLVMRLVDGEFPDYSRVIPQKIENSATINRDEFMHALKRISVLSSEKSKGVKVKLETGLLELSSSNPDLGDAREELDMSYNGPEINIGFNARYIIDILQVMNEEFISLHLKDNLSPGLIEAEENKEFFSVIMPMRL
ncbi:MAG TPA: DNA polymerase III subunit beta [Geopsychrobacteraceae bacterium]|nr:DNA polymerase III subunit beta [Geopsychrobacteraceae bacterium]